MNILLAEADVPYDKLYGLDASNGEFEDTDVAIVLGANDVCNPARRWLARRERDGLTFREARRTATPSRRSRGCPCSKCGTRARSSW